jgi:hypothetical protein
MMHAAARPGLRDLKKALVLDLDANPEVAMQNCVVIQTMTAQRVGSSCMPGACKPAWLVEPTVRCLTDRKGCGRVSRPSCPR